jgi:hypothetical protein
MSSSNMHEKNEMISNNCIQITNKKIVAFYKLHPTIDIDEINLYFINMIHNFCLTNTNTNINTNNIDNILTSSILSTMQRENVDKICQKQYFTNVLSKIYTHAEIIHNCTDVNYDFIFFKKLNSTRILLKSFTIESNLSNEDVISFKNLINKENCCGIMLSQNSGISNKTNYQIDILANNNIIIYLHNVKYNESIISSAIDIIDTLYNKFREYFIQNNGACVIQKEILDSINIEYQVFISQKNTLIDTVKEYSKKILSQIETCQFNTLNIFLSDKYNNPIKVSGLVCNLCSKYSAHNLKALAAHKRGCVRRKKI